MRILSLFLLLGSAACGSDPTRPQHWIRVSPDSVELLTGQVQQLEVTAKLDTARVTFRSTDSSVVVVRQFQLEARAAGEAWVFAAAPAARGDSVYVRVLSRAEALGRLRITASLVQSAGGYRGVVEIENPTASRTSFGYDATCSPVLLVHRSAPRPVLWDQRRQLDSTPIACKWTPVDVPLAAGGRLTLQTPAASVTAILGDSLDAGDYATSVRLRLGHWERRDAQLYAAVLDSVLVLPAGNARIATGQ